MNYTIKDFRNDFPDDKACLAHIFKSRYPNGLECLKCHGKKFYPIENRRAYACACGFQTYPTEGTIFHKSPTSLASWFHAIFLMSQSKNGVSAMEIMRQIGVTYKCAWRIAKQIRRLMKSSGNPLSGIVEVDETYVGGNKRRGKGNRPGEHTPVFGAIERGGDIRLHIISTPTPTKEAIYPLIQNDVTTGSEIMTDGSRIYDRVKDLGYGHSKVNHGAHEYVRDDAHTNSIDGFWSHFKRSVSGTYCSVSPKHLRTYLDEFSFHYDHRYSIYPLPMILLARAGRPA